MFIGILEKKVINLKKKKMSSKREEEKNEKIIRGLMKLPPNRRCINCNSLGPQYVCTNFWTFVCMTCSGIHREFTHRVKSVSMAKFTSQEVDALQKGGNQRAKELFMASWDPQKQRLPDNSNIDKVREFIKNVYVDRKYLTDKPSDRPPKDPQRLRNHEGDTRRANSYHSFSQSPPYDFQYEERQYGKYATVLSRKPGSDRGTYEGKLTSFLSPSPSHSDYSVSTGSDPFRSDVQSPSSQRDIGSPYSDNSRDFYGEAPRDLTVDRNPDAICTSNKESAPQPQRAASSGSFGGLDLFDASFAPQTVTSSPSNSQLPAASLAQSIDLFQEVPISSASTFAKQQSQIPQPPSPLKLYAMQSKQQTVVSSAVATPVNDGWANFDVPQNLVPLAMENSVAVVMASVENVVKNFNPFSGDQESAYQEFAGHDSFASAPTLRHERTQNLEPPTNNTEIWNAFGDSPGLQPVQTVLQNHEKVAPGLSPNADNSLDFGVYEARPHVLAADQKSTSNPFDLPDESFMEPGNMFWDTSSLQAALPNAEEQESYVGGLNPWFPENPVSSFASGRISFDPPHGSLEFIAAQALTPQAPVASIGGNPFA